MDVKSVTEHFQGFFTGTYDGSYGTPQSDQARRDFSQLTDYHLIWAQVHGDFKDAAKRALFQKYPHWPELYQACKDAIREHCTLETPFEGGNTLAKIMRDAMTILRARNGFNAPRWWLPIVDNLRGRDHAIEKMRGPKKVNA
jgi:hypothetical protein